MVAIRAVIVVSPKHLPFSQLFEVIRNPLVRKHAILAFSSLLKPLDVSDLIRVGVHAFCEDPRFRRCCVTDHIDARVLHMRISS